MTILTKALLALIAALTLAVGVLWWQDSAHRHDAIEAAVAPRKEQAAIAAAKHDTVTIRLAAQRDTVTRVLTRVRTDTLVLSPQTAQDTATALAQLPALSAAYDTLKRSCGAFVSACDAFKASAETRFRADAAVIATQEALLKSRPPKRNWHLGVGPSCSAIYDPATSSVRKGCGVSAGFFWTPF